MKKDKGASPWEQIDQGIADGYRCWHEGGDEDAALDCWMDAWQNFISAAEARPDRPLGTIQRRMRESITPWMTDLLGLLEHAALGDTEAPSRLRDVCEVYLSRFSDACSLPLAAARTALARAITWAEDHDAARSFITAWLEREPHDANGWIALSESYFRPGYVPEPSDDPDEATAVLELGLKRVEGRANVAALHCQLASVHSALGRANKSWEAFLAAEASWGS